MFNQRKITLDNLYSTHRDAYKALPCPPFGKSDHNSILLIPAYKQKWKQEALVNISIKKWSDEADAVLLAQTGIYSGIPPMALRSKPHQSLASSINVSMMSTHSTHVCSWLVMAHYYPRNPGPTPICIPPQQIHRWRNLYSTLPFPIWKKGTPMWECYSLTTAPRSTP